jgi:N-carbamoyl-L-amino-acid hydrolase
VIVEARRMCESGGYGQLRATVGDFDFDIGEGQTNVIPHRAVITLTCVTPTTLS